MNNSRQTHQDTSLRYHQHATRLVEAAKKDPTIMDRLQNDPHAVLRQVGLDVPQDRLVHIIDESAGDLVLKLPAFASRAKQSSRFKDAPIPEEGAAWVNAVGTTLHHFTGSIWPVGYKGNDRFDFVVPNGSRITEILLISEETVGQGARMLSRPDDGSGPGSYSVRVHWWINAYQETYYTLFARIAPTGNNEGAFQLGGLYEISGFMHTSNNWEPIIPEPAYGSDDQILWTQLE